MVPNHLKNRNIHARTGGNKYIFCQLSNVTIIKERREGPKEMRRKVRRNGFIECEKHCRRGINYDLCQNDVRSIKIKRLRFASYKARTTNNPGCCDHRKTIVGRGDE